MAPRLYSRHTFCTGQDDSDGRAFLSEREPFRYRSLPDNLIHTVAQGDTLWHLAYRYFQPLPRAAGLWWVIADFQPDPVFDPTLALAEGSTLIIPSVRTVLERVFAESRRQEEVV
jgi:hypothetical protein